MISCATRCLTDLRPLACLQRNENVNPVTNAVVVSLLPRLPLLLLPLHRGNRMLELAHGSALMPEWPPHLRRCFSRAKPPAYWQAPCSKRVG
jgi:hypothetical protein